MAPFKPHLVVVLGMHRSGTSATTRGLQALGVELGERLTPGVAGVNEKGFFEDTEINNLNIEILESLEKTWHSVAMIPDEVFLADAFSAFRERAKALLAERLGETPFGLKDPRIARLLPFWKSVFSELDIRVSYVIAIRNPLSVAHSLLGRDAMNPVKSYYLWVLHVLPSILLTADAPRVVVDFDSLMSAPGEQLKRIADALNLPYAADSAGVDDYANEFLDASLLHARFTAQDLRADAAVPGIVVETFEVLLRLANDQMNLAEPATREYFEQRWSDIESISALLGCLDESEAERLQLQERLSQHFEQIIETQRERLSQHFEQIIETQRERLSVMETDWRARGEHIEFMSRLLAEREAHIETVSVEWKARGEHIENLAQKIQELEQENEEWKARGKYIENLAQKIQELEQENFAFKTSRCGKLFAFFEKIQSGIAGRTAP